MKINIDEQLEQIKKDRQVICTQGELDTLIEYGYIIQSNDIYYNRNGKEVKVDIYKPKKIDINLTGIINKCEELRKETGYYRIYCMTKKHYKELEKENKIIKKDNYNFYNEWLIFLV